MSGKTDLAIELALLSKGKICFPAYSVKHARFLVNAIKRKTNRPVEIKARLSKGLMKQPFRSRRAVNVYILEDTNENKES